MIKSIPLNKLVASPRNVRKRSDPAADAELKASVAAHGLLQNLAVVFEALAAGELTLDIAKAYGATRPPIRRSRRAAMTKWPSPATALCLTASAGWF